MNKVQLKSNYKSQTQTGSKFKTFVSKKKFLLGSMASVLCTVPIGVGIAQSVANTYEFNGQRFSSLDSALNYAKKNSIVKQGLNSSWTITVNGQDKTFANSQELRKSLYDQYITTQLVKTTTNLNNYADQITGVINNNSQTWDNIYEASAQAYQVFQGKNDVAYSTNASSYATEADAKKAAYDSYYDQKSGYLFNNIYFSSKTDLQRYLVTDYLPHVNENKVNNTIVLQGPNGVKSSPINLESKDALSEITSFVTTQAQRILTYTNSKTGEVTNIDKSNINNVLANVSSNDLDYIHVQSNEGQSRYVIDNNYEDSANLIGPYFYNGTLDVGAFMNKSMWKKVNGVTDSVYVESKVDSMIGSFFTSIINDDAALNASDAEQSGSDPLLFRTLLVDNDGNSYDAWFLKKLGELSPELKAALVQANVTLMNGKKYNTFYKIPILYSFAMQRAISWGLGQDVINLIVDYFTNVCNFIQDAIELVAVDKSLLVSKDGKSIFSVANFFQIGNPEYDLNTSTEYFLNEIKTKYPKLVAVMDTYISAQNNMALMSGMIPFSSTNADYLSEFGIMGKDEYSAISSKLEVIYNIYSSLNYEDMMKTFIKNSTDEKVIEIKSFPEDQWKEKFDKLSATYSGVALGTMLSAIGAKNSNYYSVAQAMLNLEIKTYLSSGQVVKGGYLSKLYSNNASRDKLGLFIDWVNANKDTENLETFRAYQAFLIDKRMSLGIINAQSIADPYNFARALSRVITFGLGTSILVGQSASKLFNHTSNPYGNYTGRQSIATDAVNSRLSGNGEDNSPLSAPTQNPLRELFDTNSVNKKSSKSTNSRTSRMTVTIDPNDASVAKQIDLLKNGNKFFAPQKRTQALVAKYDSIAIAGIGSLVKSDVESFDHVNVKDKIAFWNKFGMIDADGSSNNGVYKAVRVMVDPVDDASIGTARSFDTIDGFTDQVIKTELNGGKYNPNNNWSSSDFVGSSNPGGSTGGGSTGGSGSGGSTGNGNGNGSGNQGGSGNGGGNNNGGTDIDTRPPTPPIDYPFDSDDNMSVTGSWNSSRPTTPPVDYPDGGSIGGGSNGSIGGGSIAGDIDEIGSLKSEKTSKTSFKQRISNWWSGTSSKFTKVKDAIMTVASYTLEIFATAMAALEIFFFIYDLIQVTYTQDFYEYTTLDGTHFYWDGGLTVSRFMGLDVKQEVGIDSMQLQTPIQITLPQVEEYYYYNKVKYYDFTEMKKDQVLYILNGGSVQQSSTFKIQYTLSSTDNKYTNQSTSIDQLVDLVLKSLGLTKREDGTLDYSGLKNDSEYISSTANSYENGVVIGASDNNQTVADNITKNIRPVYITYLPDLVNGVANGTVSTKFTYPGNYYDGNKVVKQDSANFKNYIVDNSANELKSGVSTTNKLISQSDYVVADPVQASKQASEKLYNKFVSSFTLNTKSVLGKEALKSDFSDLNSENLTANIYTVKTLSGEKIQFVSEEKAMNYVLSMLNFSTNGQNEKSYIYNGEFFQNESSLKNYVYRNSVKLN